MNFKIFNAIKDDEELKVNEKYFYCLIINYSNEKGYAYPSYDQLMKDMNTTNRTTISSIIKRLVEKGYIEYVKGNSVKNANRYYPLKYVTLTDNESATSNEIVTSDKIVTSNEIVTGTSSESVTSTSNKTVTINKKEKKNKKKNIYSEIDIAEIRKLYPGDKNKKEALAKLPDLLNEYGKDQLIRCIERYKNFVSEKRKTFNQQYKNEKTFWNGGYMDYLDSEINEIVKEKPIEHTDKKYTTEGIPPDVEAFLSGRA